MFGPVVFELLAGLRRWVCETPQPVAGPRCLVREICTRVVGQCGASAPPSTGPRRCGSPTS